MAKTAKTYTTGLSMHASGLAAGVVLPLALTGAFFTLIAIKDPSAGQILNLLGLPISSNKNFAHDVMHLEKTHVIAIAATTLVLALICTAIAAVSHIHRHRQSDTKCHHDYDSRARKIARTSAYIVGTIGVLGTALAACFMHMVETNPMIGIAGSPKMPFNDGVELVSKMDAHKLALILVIAIPTITALITGLCAAFATTYRSKDAQDKMRTDLHLAENASIPRTKGCFTLQMSENLAVGA